VISGADCDLEADALREVHQRPLPPDASENIPSKSQSTAANDVRPQVQLIGRIDRQYIARKANERKKTAEGRSRRTIGPGKA
jgi:hypothetical protein